MNESGKFGQVFMIFLFRNYFIEHSGKSGPT
jgi:hypothetical protein